MSNENTQSKKILLTLPADLLEKLDEYCKEHFFERSEFLRQLIRSAVLDGILEKTEDMLGTGKMILNKEGKPEIIDVEDTRVETTAIGVFSTPQQILAEAEAKAAPLGLGFPKPVKNSAFKRCGICNQLKEGVAQVEYIFEGERTVDDMCPGCERQIPGESRIKEYSLTDGTLAPETTISQEVKPYPKPIKKKK